MSTVVVEETPETPEEAEAFSQVGEEAEALKEATNESPEYEVPKKFQGKSMEDIISSYSNLEKEMGRKSQEVGELRKLTDGFLQQTLNQNTPEPNKVEPAEEVDIFDDPNAYVDKVINNHPKFRELEEQSKVQAASATTQKLEAAHPDYLEVVSDAKFQEWVQESPIRTQQYVNAHNYDYDSAMELLGNWKASSMVSGTQEELSKQESKRNEALKAAKGVPKTSSESTAGKKIYRRADLIRLNQSDPERYNSMAKEIQAAYAEGRVK